MALSNYLYFVVVEKFEDNKFRAHFEKVHRLSNLKSQFTSGRHLENIDVIHLAKSKKDAEMLTECWNANYKTNNMLHSY